MNICVITAMSSELEALEKSFSSLDKKGPLHYSIGDTEIHLLKCGVLFRNPKRLKRKLDILRESGLIILCGICGAVGKNLKVGDIVIPDKIIDLESKAGYIENLNHDGLFDFLKKCGLRVTTGCVLGTSDSFVSTSKKNELSMIDIVDMESYNVLNWLSELKISVICIRCVSDSRGQKLPDEKSIVEYMIGPKNFLVTNWLKSPITCYRLLKMSFLNKIALKKLAEFVSGFILFQTKRKVES